MPSFDAPRQSVKEYMQNFVNNAKDAAIDKATELSSKAIAAQILEMKAIAKSIKKSERDALLGENFLDTIKRQEKLVDLLLKGQKLTAAQQGGLEDVLKTFYNAVDDYSVSSEKLTKNFNALIKKDLPDVIKNRLANDAKAAEKRGKQTNDGNINIKASAGDKEGSLGVFKTFKDIKSTLTRLYTKTEGFQGWFKDSWESMSYAFSNLFTSLLDKLTSSELWKDLLKLGLILGGSLLTGLFKTGQLAPIMDSLRLAFQILYDFGKKMWEIVTSIDWQGKVLEPAQQFFAALMNSFIKIIDELSEPLLKVFDLALNGLADLTGALLDAITDVLEPTTDAFNMLMKIVLDLGANLIPPLVATFEDLFSAASEVWNTLMGALQELEPEFQLVGDILGTVGSIAGRLVRILGKLLVPVFKGVISVVTLAVKALNPLLKVIKLAAQGFDMLFGVIENFLNKFFKLGNKDEGDNNKRKKRSSIGDQAREWDYSTKGAQGTQSSYGSKGSTVVLGAYSAKDEGGLFPKYSWTSASYQDVEGLSGSSLGDRLASTSEKIVNGRRNPGGWCLKNVADAMDKAGLGPVSRQPSAYMFAPFLARNPKFKEASVAPKDLAKLPRGAVVVWGKGTTKHGHISIADGKGNELSDYIGRQRTTQKRRDGLVYGPPRVFIPKDTNMGQGGGDVGDSINDIGNSDVFQMFQKLGGAMFSKLMQNITPPELVKVSQATQEGGMQPINLDNVINHVRGTVETVKGKGLAKAAYEMSALTPDEIMNATTNNNIQAAGKNKLPQIIPPAAKAIQAGRKKEIDDSDLMILQSLIFS